MFAVTLILLYVLLTIPTQHSKSWTHQQLVQQLLNAKLHPAGRRPICLPICNTKSKHLLLLLITLSGDIEVNPGPPKKESVYPCGLCEHPVTWNCRGVCCDGCNIWHHSSGIELCSKDYELLEKSNVQWICCKCESMTISSFTFKSYNLETSNLYEQITGLDSAMESISSVFSPLKSSSPKEWKYVITQQDTIIHKPKEITSE